MLFLAVILIGIVSVLRLLVDLLPDISFPRLVISTAYRDAGPAEMEEFVTRRIEEVVATLPGVRRIRSTSRSGNSLVFVEMVWGTDMDFATLALREKLDNLRHAAFSESVEKPVILRTDPGAKPIMNLAITGEGTLYEFYTLSRDVFRRRFEQIAGVAMTTVTGGRKREIHVEIEMDKAQTLGISIEQIENALKRANDSRPGGSIRKGRYRYALRTVGEFRTLKDIGETVIFTGTDSKKQTPVLLRDIAVISDNFKEKTGETRYNGAPAIGLLITKESGANTVDVAAKMQQAIEQLRRQYQRVKITVVDNQAEFISESINQVRQALFYSGILAFLVLFFFLHDIRNPLNIAISMPISIIATFALMYFFDVSLNMISLGGLALGVGMLVDNSIVVLENIFRRQKGELPLETAAVLGAREVTMPIIASTLTTIAVFFPILYIDGVAGQLFRDQSLTVSFSLLCSLVVALALLPMIAVQWRTKTKTIQPAAGLSFEKLSLKSLWRLINALPRLVIYFFRGLLRYWRENLQKGYEKLFTPAFSSFEKIYLALSKRYENRLLNALENPRRTLLITLTLFLLALISSMQIDRRLMPKVEQGIFVIDITLPAGSRLEITRQLNRQVENVVMADTAVSSVFSRVGNIEDEMRSMQKHRGANFSEITVFLHPGHKRRQVAARLQKKLREIDAGAITVRAAATAISEVLGSAQADLTVHVRSNETDAALQVADNLRRKILQIEGVRQCVSDTEEKQPELHLKIDRRKVALAGADIATIARHIRSFIHGALPTDFKSFDRKIPILARADTNSRESIKSLLRSQIKINQMFLPVSEFVSLEQALIPAAIERENQVRQQTLSVTIGGRSHFAVSEEILALIAEMKIPDNMQVVLGGQQQEMQRSFHEMLFAFFFAFVLVFMILAAQFESLLLPFIIIFSIPLALIGVVAGLLLTGQSFNVMSLIGIVVLVGIVVNDAIVKVDFIRQERQRGADVLQAILLPGKNACARLS